MNNFGNKTNENYAAFTTCQLISGKSNLFDKNSIYSFNWIYKISESSFKQNGLDINIVDHPEVSVFAVDYIDKESVGSIVMKHVVNDSYAVFCENKSNRYDVIIIVHNNQPSGLFLFYFILGGCDFLIFFNMCFLIIFLLFCQ